MRSQIQKVTHMLKNIKHNRLTKLWIKRLSAVVAGLVLLGTFGAISVLGFEYSTANKLFKDGENLLAAQKYTEAISKFALAKSNWSPSLFKKQLESKLQEAILLQHKETQRSGFRPIGINIKDLGIESINDLKNRPDLAVRVEEQLKKSKITTPKYNPPPTLNPTTTIIKESALPSPTSTPTLTPIPIPVVPSGSAPLVAEEFECIGPDGVRFRLPQKECDEFNKAWGDVKPQPIPTPTLKANSPKIPDFIIGEGTSYTDSLGIIHFFGKDGVYGTAYTDSLGFTYYSDNTGRSITSHTDSLGFTNNTDNYGSSVTSHTDSLGFTNFYGSGGLSGSAYTDSLGFTNYHDNFGRSTTCHTDTLGFTTCY